MPGDSAERTRPERLRRGLGLVGEAAAAGAAAGSMLWLKHSGVPESVLNLIDVSRTFLDAPTSPCGFDR